MHAEKWHTRPFCFSGMAGSLSKQPRSTTEAGGVEEGNGHALSKYCLLDSCSSSQIWGSAWSGQGNPCLLPHFDWWYTVFTGRYLCFGTQGKRLPTSIQIVKSNLEMMLNKHDGKSPLHKQTELKQKWRCIKFQKLSTFSIFQFDIFPMFDWWDESLLLPIASQKNGVSFIPSLQSTDPHSCFSAWTLQPQESSLKECEGKWENFHVCMDGDIVSVLETGWWWTLTLFI